MGKDLLSDGPLVIRPPHYDASDSIPHEKRRENSIGIGTSGHVPKLYTHFDTSHIYNLQDEIHDGPLLPSKVLGESCWLCQLVGQLLAVEEGCDKGALAHLRLSHDKYFINFHFIL